MKLTKEDIKKYGTRKERRLLEEITPEGISILRSAAQEIEKETNGKFELVRVKPDGTGIIKINGSLGEMWETSVAQEDYHGQTEFVIYPNYPGAGQYGPDSIHGTASQLAKEINNMKLTKEDIKKYGTKGEQTILEQDGDDENFFEIPLGDEQDQSDIPEERPIDDEQESPIMDFDETIENLIKDTMVYHLRNQDWSGLKRDAQDIIDLCDHLEEEEKGLGLGDEE